MQFSPSGYQFWITRVEQELNVICGSMHFAKRLVTIYPEKLQEYFRLNYLPMTAADMLFVLDMVLPHQVGVAA
jgi:hypothetical protein